MSDEIKPQAERAQETLMELRGLEALTRFDAGRTPGGLFYLDTLTTHILVPLPTLQKVTALLREIAG